VTASALFIIPKTTKAKADKRKIPASFILCFDINWQMFTLHSISRRLTEVMKLLALIAAVLAFANLSQGKTFGKCELAKKLSATFARNKLADWNCLVKHESSYNSGVRGRQNKNGSYDYGIFQINDKYWCKVGQAGGDCNIDCNSKWNCKSEWS
jgi:lysozyme C